NPLSMAAAPDAVADQVVGALRALFSEGEVRGSSDRYLRNAVIAALACEPSATLWHVARLLEVGEAGTAARAAAAERLIPLPAYAEIATFLAEELPVQLAAARATTTAKLDAPSNKLARLLNSPAVKRVLLNDSLSIDLDRVIDRAEVLVVRGALGEIGAGNVAVLMQLLLGMLDAALSRVQDRRAAGERHAVALKVDEAPLVINEGFAQTLALKRSAGLETVACWQTDAQWPIELRDQLDALFAHRVLFATASAADARAASGLLLSEFSDQLRPSDEQTMRLATPDVRLHLPRHTAIVSWTTPAGRERPFIATTLPMTVDRSRIERHAVRQMARGAHELRELVPPADLFALQSPPAAVQPAPEILQSPLHSASEPPPSFGELCDLDASVRVRWLPLSAPRRDVSVAAEDRELLEWLVGARCALTTQVHRRVRPGRALTTTQRQLKRLADAGLVARFQLHRPDGGGVPQCYVATAAAIELLSTSRRSAPTLGEDALPGLLNDLHLVGWLLAFESCAAGAVSEVLGPGRARIAPGGQRALSPADLELAPGLRPRDFHRAGQGERRVVETFAAVRPDAVVELRLDGPLARHVDLLVVREPHCEAGWLESYDHLVSGWWRSVPRYARLGAPPLVVVLCTDPARAVQQARSADSVLSATLARIGADPSTWERPGRARIYFAAEGDAHAGSLAALRVPELPPDARAAGRDELLRVELLVPRPDTQQRATPPPWR
ncbi:MAG TPA: replication-relaxation family protein, partial [Solirubrobacteraceae bacterium]|nr:replication-relaxation family protein [Solirubrobacteraceae bacterium]